MSRLNKPATKAAKGKTKILVLSHISEMVGGAERSMLDTFELWEKQFGIEPEFILRKPLGSLTDELDKRGWKHHDLEYTFWSYSKLPDTPEQLFSHSVQNCKAILDIEKLIQTSKPDVVMTNTIVAPWAALAAYYQDVPHVWFIREYGDLDHGRAFELGREKTFEDIDSLSCLVATNSRTLAEHVEQYVTPSKVTTMYTPFDLSKIDEKLAHNATSPYKYSDSLKLVITGNITESKGQLEAIKAVSILNDLGKTTELCVIGSEGPKAYRKLLNKVIQQHRLKDKVHFVGHQDNPLSFVALSDVGIMASRKEAFGRVTFEYIASGKPVVGANSGATPEMVLNNKTGFLYEPGDAADMANQLQKYYNDKRLLQAHGQHARSHAISMMQEQFSAERLYKKVQDAITHYVRDTTRPLNFSHSMIANQGIAAAHALSVKKLAVTRAKQRLKQPYKLAKNILERR